MRENQNANNVQPLLVSMAASYKEACNSRYYEEIFWVLEINLN